jgi:F-type H+-transporting ATPase subunit gamma
LVDKLEYAEAGALTDTLVNLFLNKEVDRVELVYNHFKNAGVQVLTHEQFLPMLPSQPKADEKPKHTDFILEPDEEQVIKVLVPKVIRLRLYSALLDSIAAEHGARTTAMQIATDNATELIKDLTLAYNKARQSAITNELIDIVGGSEVLK